MAGKPFYQCALQTLSSYFMIQQEAIVWIFVGEGRLFQLQLEPLPAQQEQLQLPLEF